MSSDDPVEAEDPDIGSPVFRSPTLSSVSAAAAARASSASTPAAPLPVLSSGLRARVGCFHRLSVSLRNVSSEPLSLSLLSIRPFQESVGGGGGCGGGGGGGGDAYGDGVALLGRKMLVAGSLTLALDQHHQPLQPGQLVQHQVLVCFTAVGRFHFQFVASQRDENETQQAGSHCGSGGCDGGEIASAIPVASSSTTPQGPPLVDASASTATAVVADDSDDPFATLDALAKSLARPSPPAPPLAPPAPASHSSLSVSVSAPRNPAAAAAAAAPIPSPLRTVRRRSMMLTDESDMHAAAAAFERATTAGSAADADQSALLAAAAAANVHADYQLDVESDSDTDEPRASVSVPFALAAPVPPSVLPDLVYRCSNIMVVQACL